MNNILKVAEELRTVNRQNLNLLGGNDLVILAIALENCQNLVTKILVRKESAN